MMRHLLLSAVAVASADLSTNATFGALGDRVTWTRDTQHRWSNKASYAPGPISASATSRRRRRWTCSGAAMSW